VGFGSGALACYGNPVALTFLKSTQLMMDRTIRATTHLQRRQWNVVLGDGRLTFNAYSGGTI
jgi:hypothetical protein